MASKLRRVTLDPMTESEYGAYIGEAVSKYALDKTESGEWAEQDALELSRADFERLLPDGIKTPDQFIFTVRDGESGKAVAVLWLALRMKAGRVEGYVFDIEVVEGFRSLGFGRATMTAGIEKARELGAQTVGLHVFGHNAVARSLYRSLGFAETNVSMSLEL
jgi:ribosomal protein S18 acetylase RimI-like enzyme